MELAEARELLLLHSAMHENAEHPKWKNGFLGSLRPYTGLNPANLDEVMQAVVAAAPALQQAQAIDREIVQALWGLCYLARLWGVHPDGMLRRNELISDDDVMRLAQWVDAIEWAVMILLDGGSVEVALSRYDDLAEVEPQEAS